MVPVNAIYIRMRDLLDEFGNASFRLTNEIAELKENLRDLGISWEGAAYDEYSRVLLSDLDHMESMAAGIGTMYTLLFLALSRYQETELKVSGMIGGFGK